MNSSIQNRYHPDQVSPPGESLQDILEELGMTQTQLAERMGRPKKTISEIINNKSAITPETALQLEHVLRVPAQFWNNRERQYREYIAVMEEREKLKIQTDWLRNFPLREMVKRGWLRAHGDAVEQLRETLNFFGIAHPGILQTSALFRKADGGDPFAVAAWLRQGEIEGQLVSCAPYNALKFKTALEQIRTLCLESPEVFLPEMQHLCADAGVAVVAVRELPKAKICGAARWLHPSKALIQLSFRYKTTDQLWFTFFHEAAHVLKHAKRGDFLDFESGENSEDEAEANSFAADFLIPTSRLRKFLATCKIAEKTLVEFAAELALEPGIVVGRLQHDHILPFNRFNKLKTRLQWAKD